MIETFRKVIRQERDALNLLLKADFPITQAICELACANHVIVTGMGKAGHVGRKFAATLSSLGKPSVFLDGGDASHGDMGVMQEGDTLVIFSKSGETRELYPVIGRARALEMPVILITSTPDSYIARYATTVFELPSVEEACNLGLAPTTSTTMMLSVADALAVSVSVENEFTTKDFRLNHPGGALGKA